MVDSQLFSWNILEFVFICVAVWQCRIGEPHFVTAGYQRRTTMEMTFACGARLAVTSTRHFAASAKASFRLTMAVSSKLNVMQSARSTSTFGTLHKAQGSQNYSVLQKIHLWRLKLVLQTKSRNLPLSCPVNEMKSQRLRLFGGLRCANLTSATDPVTTLEEHSNLCLNAR